MINEIDFKSLIIAPALEEIGLMSQNAVELLYAIACHESHCGTYLKQRGGCALSPYQIEPVTYYDIWKNVIPSKKGLSSPPLKL